MYRSNKICHQPLNQQRGSMLVIALFVIIVLSSLAFTMIQLINSSSNSVLHEVYGLRAQQAARAGLETLLSASFPLNSSAQACDTTAQSAPAFSNIPGFTGCAYTARCTTEQITFAGEDILYYKYTSTGQCELADGVVSRTLSVDAIQDN